MRAVVIFVLSFVASILGYQILTPGEQNGVQIGWTNSGPQSVTWKRVNTDDATFDAVLTNQVMSGFTDQTLATNVDGTTGSTQFSPPSGTFPTGAGFRLNFMSTQQADTILAQSNQFNITASSTSGSTSGTTGGTTGTTVTATSSPTSQTGFSDSSGTSTDIIPTSSTSTSPTSGAASSYPAQTGLLALISFLGFALA